MARRRLGRQFGLLWAAYAVSAYGSGLGFGAFALIAINVLHAGPTEVSALPAASLAVGALVAVPLGPWIETHRKRPAMIAMDLLRFLAMCSIPVAYWLHRLTFSQLLVVAVVVAMAKIAFSSASGAYLKSLVAPEDLLVANGRFESTTWTSIAIGPPLGGAAIGLFGYVTTVIADAVSYLLSAIGVAAIRDGEAPPASAAARLRLRDLPDSWRYLLAHDQLRPVFLNNVLVKALILAPEPLLAILLLRRLGFAPWQYGLAFALPCVGGFVGSRVARPLVTRFGQRRIMLVGGAFGVLWPIGLAFVPAGAGGLALVVVLELGVILGMSVYNPVVATYRLERTAPERVARTLSAWSITGNLTIATLTVVWGVLASLIGLRAAIAVAGVLILTTPLLLLRVKDAGPEIDLTDPSVCADRSLGEAELGEHAA